MKKLVDLLKELEEKALDISWNPYEEKALKDGETITFTIAHYRSGGKNIREFESWALLDGSADKISEEHLEEIRSQYVADCRAEAGISADNEDYEDYDCDDIDVNRYQEDEGYFNIVNNIYSMGHDNIYYIDNRYEFADQILKILERGNPSVEELFKYMI